MSTEELTETTSAGTVSLELIRSICREAGADDVGVVEVSREGLAAEREDMLRIYPRAKSAITILMAVNRENVQSPAINVVDDEYRRSYEEISDISRKIVKRLNAEGIRGVYNTYGFPSDTKRWPGKLWDLALKTIAIEAGLGAMGTNRLVLHPRYGAFVSLSTILIDTEVESYDSPLGEDDNPCIKCNLCVAVCPTKAVMKDGFGFLGCLTHNYRNTTAGFVDWVETVIDSKNSKAYRNRVRDDETIAMWQALTFGHSYKCSYCMSVCPAGSEPSALYNKDKKGYVQDIVRPLRTKPEDIYVVKGTIAEAAVRKNPAKNPRLIKTPIRPSSIATFLLGMPIVFNPLAAEGVTMTVHFTFWGKEEVEATVVIKDSKITVSDGLIGKANLRVKVDTEVWLAMLGERISLPRALLTGKLKVNNPLLMGKFKSCLTI